MLKESEDLSSIPTSPTSQWEEAIAKIQESICKDQIEFKTVRGQIVEIFGPVTVEGKDCIFRAWKSGFGARELPIRDENGVKKSTKWWPHAPYSKDNSFYEIYFQDPFLMATYGMTISTFCDDLEEEAKNLKNDGGGV